MLLCKTVVFKLKNEELREKKEKKRPSFTFYPRGT